MQVHRVRQLAGRLGPICVLVTHVAEGLRNGDAGQLKHTCLATAMFRGRILLGLSGLLWLALGSDGDWSASDWDFQRAMALKAMEPRHIDDYPDPVRTPYVAVGRPTSNELHAT